MSCEQFEEMVAIFNEILEDPEYQAFKLKCAVRSEP